MFFWVEQAKRIRQQTILQKSISSLSSTAGRLVRGPQQLSSSSESRWPMAVSGCSWTRMATYIPMSAPHPWWSPQNLQKHFLSLYQLSMLTRSYVNLNPVWNSNPDNICLVHGWCSVYVWWMHESLPCYPFWSSYFLLSPIFNCNWLFKNLAPKRIFKI